MCRQSTRAFAERLETLTPELALDDRHGILKACNDVVSLNGVLGSKLGPVPSPYENRGGSYSAAHFKITRLIPDHPAESGIEPQLPRSLLHHRRSRLAAGTAIVRRVRTVVDAVQPDAFRRKDLPKSLMDDFKTRDIEHPTSYR